MSRKDNMTMVCDEDLTSLKANQGEQYPVHRRETYSTCNSNDVVSSEISRSDNDISIGDIKYEEDSVKNDNKSCDQDEILVYESHKTQIHRTSYIDANALAAAIDCDAAAVDDKKQSLKIVARKTLVEETPSAEDVSRLNNEFNILSRNLKHCPVVRNSIILDSQPQQALGKKNEIYLEWIDGQTLTEWMDRHNADNKLTQPKTEFLLSILRVAKEIAHAICLVHEAGVVHNDITADNILIIDEIGEKNDAGRQVRVKIIDFGFASTCQMNEVDDEGNTVNDDLYHLGLLFYEMMAGDVIASSENHHCQNRSNFHESYYPRESGVFHNDPGSFAIDINFGSSDNCDFALPESLPRSVSTMITDLLEMGVKARPYDTARQVYEDLESFVGSPDIFLFNEKDDSKNSPSSKEKELTFPSDKLYGRDEEVKALLGAYQRCMSSKKAKIPRKKGSTHSEYDDRNEGTKETSLGCEKDRKGGPVELVLISGYSGTGKSSLVRRIQQEISLDSNDKGYFISCKFDQLRRVEPYSAFVVAFTDLCDQILARDETTIECMRHLIERAVGRSGTEILINFVPRLSFILGQPEEPDLGLEIRSLDGASSHSCASRQRRKSINDTDGPETSSKSNKNPSLLPSEFKVASSVEAQNRFNYIVRSFVRIISQPSHPVCLFVDDLQWADAASLELLKTLATDRVNSSFLLVGCYRDNEVNINNEDGQAHPLLGQIREMEKKNVSITNISIGNLSKDRINWLISDTLGLSRRFTSPLASLVHKKTHGNVFFVREFLTSLKGEGLLFYSKEEKRWMWNEDGIYSKNISDNVVALLAGKIKRLPVETQNVLKIAACVGSYFDFEILSHILVSRKCCAGGGYPVDSANEPHDHEHSFHNDDELIYNLDMAISEGMIDKISSGCGDDCCHKEYCTNGCGSITSSIRYKFSHDRIQQAAYSLLSGHLSRKVHLRIGNTMLQLKVQWKNNRGMTDSYLFAAVDQLNRGSSFLIATDQQLHLSRLNLQAGERAMTSGAFETASTYLKAGLRLIDGSSWQDHYYLRLDLSTALVEAEFCNGNHNETETIVSEITTNAISVHDKFRAYTALIKSLGAQGKVHEAINTGFECLTELGEPFPTRVSKRVILADLMKTKIMLRGKADKAFASLPIMTDRSKLAAMRIVSSIFSYCLIGKPEMVPLVAFRMMRLSLRYGVSQESAFGVTIYGVMLVAMLGDLQGGYQFGKLALKLVERSESREWYAHVGNMVHHFLTHWTEHAAVTIAPLLRCYSVGRETGDNEYAMYSAMNYCIHSFLCGRPLSMVEKDMNAFAQQMKECGQDGTLIFHLPFHQAVLNLMGRSDGGDPLVLTGEAMDQDQMLDAAVQNKHEICSCKIYFNRLLLAYLFGDYKLAEEMLERSVNFSQIMTSMFHVCTYTLYEGLTAFTLARVHEKKKWESRGRKVLKKMKKWSKYSPGNCLHKALLLQAECAALQGKVRKALNFYDSAISAANKSGYMQEEALAYERTALYFHQLDNREKSAWHFARSHQLYLDWGAIAKADFLQSQFSSLVVRAKHRESFTMFVRGRSSVSPNFSAPQSESSVSSFRLLLSVES